MAADSQQTVRPAVRFHPIVLSLLLATIAAFAAGEFFWSATEQGLGLSGDSVDYVVSSRKLQAGEGYLTLDGKRKFKPLTQFPPGYPALLASLQVVDQSDVIVRARWIHCLLHVTAVLLTGVLCWQVTRSHFCGAIASLLFAVTLPLLMASTMLLSEVLYICLLLLAMIALCRCLTNPQPFCVACVAGVLFAVCFLTRYMGAVLVPVGLISVMLWLPNRLKTRITCAVSLGLCALVAPALWSNYVAAVSGLPAARSFLFHPPPVEESVEFLVTVGAWLLPRDPSIVPFFGAVMVLIFAAWLGALFWMRNDEDRASGYRNARLMAVILFVIAHPLFLLFCRTFFDANIRARHRLLFPMFPLVVTIGVAGAAMLLRRVQWSVPAVTAVAAVVVASCLPLTLTWVGQTRDRGQGYASVKWKKSPTLAMVRSAPQSHVIYSNGYDVIYLLTGRRVYQLPKARLQSEDRSTPWVGDMTSRMLEQVRGENGWIVYFNNMGRENYLVQEDYVRHFEPLQALNETQLKDGRIYRFAAGLEKSH